MAKKPKSQDDLRNAWRVFRGSGSIDRLPEPPSWRKYEGRPETEDRKVPAAKPARFEAEEHEIDLINAALLLRRPLLVTGPPGTGKTTLARAVAHELELGEVLTWPINTRSTLHEGKYGYDAIARMQDHNLRSDQTQASDGPRQPADIGRYITLGPLGTALLPRRRPRVLLIDEIDKSDIDLPNDLLHVFEEGQFTIPELKRLPKEADRVTVKTYDKDVDVALVRGRVECAAFPFVVLTSNGERDFPPPFLRRCLRMELDKPDETKLEKIVRHHFVAKVKGEGQLITDFVTLQKKSDLATDQFLNALYLRLQSVDLDSDKRQKLFDAIHRELK